MQPKPATHTLGRLSSRSDWLFPLLTFQCVSACVALAQDQTTSAPSSAPSTYSPSAPAQSAPASASGYPGMTPSTPFAGTSQLAAGAPATLQSALTAGPGLFQLGPISVHPHIAYDVSYGNTLQAGAGQRSNTLINDVSPGIMFGLGSHWFLDYTPTLRFYSSHQFQDGVDHVVNFSGGTTYHDWAFGLSQGFSTTSQPLVETAAQTDQTVYTTGASASHTLGSKMSFDLTANQNLRYVNQGTILEPVVNSREWSTMEWLNYQFVPHFSAGIGVGFTYDNLSFGPDMTSEQYQGRINWRASDKLSFLLTGGLDDRQFLNTPLPDLLSPIFSASAQYQLFENTSFSLSASRSISPSYFQNALSEGTTISGGIHQRLLGKLYLDLSGGYATTTYHATASIFNPATTSNYELTSFGARLSTVFLKRINAAIYFQENFVSSSSAAAIATLYNYSSTQVGLSLAYRF